LKFGMRLGGFVFKVQRVRKLIAPLGNQFTQLRFWPVAPFFEIHFGNKLHNRLAHLALSRLPLRCAGFQPWLQRPVEYGQ